MIVFSQITNLKNILQKIKEEAMSHVKAQYGFYHGGNIGIYYDNKEIYSIKISEHYGKMYNEHNKDWLDKNGCVQFKKSKIPLYGEPSVRYFNGEFIYFIEQSGFTKIGKTKDPEQRLRQLNTGFPVLPKYQYVVKVKSSSVEDTLHSMYAYKRGKGEWFNLSTEEIEQAIKYLELHHGGQVAHFVDKGENEINGIWLKTKEK
jgi:hypothetical protein